MSEFKSPSECVGHFMMALDANQLKDAAGYLADNFVFAGWTPQVMNKETFLGVINNIKEGIPNLRFNLHNSVEQGPELVTGTINVTGHQTDSFIIPALGTPPVPQMDGDISLPEEEVTYRLERGLITAMEVKSATDGGIKGLFRQLGTEMIFP